MRKKRQEKIAEEVRREMNKIGTSVMNRMRLVLCLVSGLLVLCTVIPPPSAIGAMLLGMLALFACCGINFYAIGCNDESGGDEYDARLSSDQFQRAITYLKLSSSFAFVILVIIMVLHGLSGYWWTFFIVFPGICSFCVAPFCEDSTETGRQAKMSVEEEARRKVLQGTIEF